MAATKYSYMISTTFPNAKLDSAALEKAIRDANFASTSLNRIDTTDDTLGLWFNAALSSADKNTLDGDSSQTPNPANPCPTGSILGDHDGEPILPPDVNAEGHQIVALDTPKTAEGKSIILTNMWADEVTVAWTSKGDDIANGTRWGSPLLVKKLETANAPETAILEWQFMEHVYIAGGMLHVMNGGMMDWCRYEIVAPATAGTSNTGAGAYDKFPVGGGLNMFIPNGTTTGDWDLDLTETLNANVGFTKVVPVTSEDKTGFFDWDHETGLATLNATQTGAFNLFDADLTLAYFLADICIMGSHMHDLQIANVDPMRLLPHWKHKLTLSKSMDDGNDLMVSPMLLLGRKTTAP